MREGAWQSYSFRVTITKLRGGAAEAEISVRLRDLTWFVVAHADWPSGAPTPAQLELLQAAVADELQTHVLAVCGVQGVLFAGERAGEA